MTIAIVAFVLGVCFYLGMRWAYERGFDHGVEIKEITIGKVQEMVNDGTITHAVLSLGPSEYFGPPSISISDDGNVRQGERPGE